MNAANVDQLSTKQFGDACEHAALAEFLFAGWPAVKMPDVWKDYDLMIIDRPDGKISVRGRREGLRNGKRTGSWWQIDADGYDWLVLMRVDIQTGMRRVYVLPRETALALASKPGEDGKRGISFGCAGLTPWASNFALNTENGKTLAK